jgi:glycosyltransferase involved in cell wall biosynthesis
VRFYVFAPGFHLRPRNTDWIYNHTLPEMTAFDPRVEVYLQRSFVNSLEYNIRAAAEIAANRLNLPVPRSLLPEIESHFDLRDVRRSGANLVYGHSPTNVTNLPLICHTGPIFEDELRSRGVSEAAVEHEKEMKRRTVARSQLTTLHSATGAETIRAIAGAKADRVRVLPFFLPHLRVVEREAVERKFAELPGGSGRIRLLFVGREARRKGLPAVLEAFVLLNARMPDRLELEVVSTFADGPVPIPALPNIVVRGETSREDVQAKMGDAHMLLMPSRFETFGWVYLEAMAAGGVAVAADLPTQREIVADGDAGVVAPGSGMALADALGPLLREPGRMLDLALAGRARVIAEYSPKAVAGRFYELGLEALELFRAERNVKR